MEEERDKQDEERVDALLAVKPEPEKEVLESVPSLPVVSPLAVLGLLGSDLKRKIAFFLFAVGAFGFLLGFLFGWAVFA